MRPAHILSVIKALYPIKRTICIEGAPGGGKTSLGRHAAKELGVDFRLVHLPTALVEDFGIPFPVTTDGGRVLEHIIPDWYPAKGRPGTENGGILMFDDRNQANADLQKVLAHICQERDLHGVPLADNWMIISTGNRMTDRAGANRILSHLRNRETVLEFDTNVDDWCRWALDNDVSPELVSFIRWRPSMLHDFKADQDRNPTPRSWVEGVNAVIGKVDPSLEYDCFRGAVGDGAASEFIAFLNVYRNLPDVDQIIKDPMKADVPTKPDVLYALAGSLANKATTTNFENVVKYASRMPAEVSVLLLMYAVRREKALFNVPAFSQWVAKHRSVLF